MTTGNQVHKNSEPSIGDMHEFAQMAREFVDARHQDAGTGIQSIDRTFSTSTNVDGESRLSAMAVVLGRQQADWIADRRAGILGKNAMRISGSDTTRKIIVAEGDSWFDYPWTDVLTLLEDKHGFDVEKVSHWGHSIESMAYDGGQLAELTRAIERVVRRGQTPHAILLSGGGNDIAGDAFAMLLNHRLSPTPGLNEFVLTGVIKVRIALAYTTVIAAVDQTCTRLLGEPRPILVHGYDYPVADGRGFWGGGLFPGPWLEPGFREKHYDALEERVTIAKTLIDHFNEALASAVALPEFRHVRMLNLRNSLSNELAGDSYKDWWDNELHPTGRGFEKIARLFADALAK